MKSGRAVPRLRGAELLPSEALWWSQAGWQATRLVDCLPRAQHQGGGKRRTDSSGEASVLRA